MTFPVLICQVAIFLFYKVFHDTWICVFVPSCCTHTIYEVSMLLFHWCSLQSSTLILPALYILCIKLPPFPPPPHLSPNIFCGLALSEQTVEIFIIFQSHKANLIHSDYSALKYIDLSTVKCLNIVNETERNFATSPPCVHVFVRCYINIACKNAKTCIFFITHYPWQYQA